MEELTFWIGLVIGILEILGRIIPVEKIKGPIGYTIELLKFISDYFNRKKPY